MAKGWRKEGYNRQLFGQRVREYRLALEWSLEHLAQCTCMNKGTLLHVEKGECHLPDDKRQRLTDVLMEALENIEHPFHRRDLLELGGLAAVSTTLGTVSSTTHLRVGAMPRGSDQEDMLSNKPYEYAEILNQQNEWRLAATFWLVAAQEAKQHGNWATWSRCLIHAGLMAVTSGQCEIAERRFKEVIDKPQGEVSTLAVAEAYMRLGWAYYEQDKFHQARQALLKSRTFLPDVGKDTRFLSAAEHGCTLGYEGDELIIALESTRLHWLGRTYVDWGMQRDNQALIGEGLVKLQKAGKYDAKFDLHGNMGFALLRQIPALLHTGETHAIENYLARSEEMLGTGGTARGHIRFHKGLYFLEEQPRKAKDFLESAHAGFIEPVYHSNGVAEVLKELSGVYLMDNKKTGDELALQYALVSTILHPYGRNFEMLQLAAHKVYWRMGENMTAFNTFWQALEEKLWRMESEPFSDLRYLMKSLRENGIEHVETIVEKARKAIDNELFGR